MFLEIQVFGAFFGLFMLYLTILYFRRKDLNIADILIWVPVWIVFLIGVIFPETLKLFMQTFNVISVVQVFTISGLMFFSIIIFYLYRSTKINKKKVERLVKIIALKEINEKKKK